LSVQILAFTRIETNPEIFPKRDNDRGIDNNGKQKRTPDAY
jgi:hypothetical protein